MQNRIDTMNRQDMQELRNDPDIWRILEERAQALALSQKETITDQGDEILTFQLGNDGYSLAAQFVREVQPLLKWTPLPSTPPFVIGLVNVRGKILTALDLRPLLDIAQMAPKAGSFLVIVNVHGTEIGLLADSVVEVQRSTSTLSPTLSAVSGQNVPWVQGLDQHMNLLLDPSLLLDDPRVIINHEAT
jgi:purine-binding chemotaxis protein CheW